MSRFGSDESPSTPNLPHQSDLARSVVFNGEHIINPPDSPLRKYRRDYYGYYGRYDDDDGDYHERED